MYHPGEDEEWRAIPGYPDYDVSNLGRVWSRHNDKLLKITFDGHYECVRLYDPNGKGRKTAIHRLVAQAFLTNIDNRPQVNHDDGDKIYNYVGNLEWATVSENALHAFRIGLRTSPIPGKRIRVVQTGNEYRTINECAKAIGGNHSNIIACLEGRRNSHKDFTFELIE